MKKISIGLVTLALIAIPAVASAQVGTGNYGPTFGLGTADLESTIVNVVQWVLGFLGLVAVIFILYGGFIWLTSGGNEEKVAKAKKIISGAVVGLIIILLAWAIVIFVVGQTNNWTA
ncbi:pilin [Patescibacteria group bacterium]|nr:pilin [Patescibacteria group bacterium]MBU0964227.1 pilin [Patescibacteria group bacterium]